VTPLVTHMPVVIGLGDRATLLFGPPATGSLRPDQEVPPPADGSDISHERATRGEAGHDQDHVPGTHLPLSKHWGGPPQSSSSPLESERGVKSWIISDALRISDSSPISDTTHPTSCGMHSPSDHHEAQDIRSLCRRRHWLKGQVGGFDDLLYRVDRPDVGWDVLRR
jgi:hypothetical protein